MKIIKIFIKKIRLVFNFFGIQVSRFETESNRSRNLKFDKWETLTEFLVIHFNRQRLGLICAHEADFVEFVVNNFKKSRSQFFQDLMVLFLLQKKENGFFVEFGATNGISFSNTHLLENCFNWSGVLAEPGKVWHKDLVDNRNCQIDFRCVWSLTKKQLMFNETECAELSTINELTAKDGLAFGRISNKRYIVETVSLNDLLLEHNVPSQIDYLSIDTEGSELSILQSFNFSGYQIGVISIEHNFHESDRGEIFELLSNNGFERVFVEYSHCDDWYISTGLV